MKSQQQARARASARRKGWLGIAAATAMLATSMGGTMLALAADGQQPGEDAAPASITESIPVEETLGSVTWSVVDQDGAPLGGTTWSIATDSGDIVAADIKDCVEAGACSDVSLTDQDPAVGIFEVDGLSVGSYVLLQTSAPDGYTSRADGVAFSLDEGQSEAHPDTPIVNEAEVDDLPDGTEGSVEGVPAPAAAPAPGTRAAAQTISCAAGNIYAIGSTGQLQWVQVAANGTGTKTDVGNRPSNVSSFNGLGIGAGGSLVIAYNRTNNNRTANIYTYNVNTGNWTNTGHSLNTTTNANGSFSGTLVAGAVDLSVDGGAYYFGGFESRSGTNNNRFKIWRYVPSTGAFTYMGYVQALSGDTNNGDMAFDRDGNLFIVRGAGGTTNVISVLKEDLANGNGSQINASVSASVSTMDNVNGVAFDRNGKAYLGASSQMRSYDMPAWTNSTSVTSGLSSSTDLASCSPPPTVVLEKNFVERYASTDQVKLQMSITNGAVLGEATTAGDTPGIQDQRVGPFPTSRDTSLTIWEDAAGSPAINFANYKSQYRCYVRYQETVGGPTLESIFSQGDGRSANIKLPSLSDLEAELDVPAGLISDAYVCRFYNSPLKAQVLIRKEVIDADAVQAPAAGWTVNAQAEKFGTGDGTVTQNPAEEQETDDGGNAKWELTFTDTGLQANLTVQETMQDDHEFVSGECVVTKLNGIKHTVILDGPEATKITGGELSTFVEPGDRVDCTYVNRHLPKGSLEIVKKFDESVPEGSGLTTSFTGGYECVVGDDTVSEGTWSATGPNSAELTATSGADRDRLPAGAVCTATENQPSGSSGLPNTSWEWDTYTVDPGDGVTIPANDSGEITVTNSAKRVYGEFQVTKAIELPEGETYDDNLQFGGSWTCVTPDAGEADITGTWSVTGEGTQVVKQDGSTPAKQIPLGSKCTATETQPTGGPIASKPWIQWDRHTVAPEAGVDAAAAAANAEIKVTNRTKVVLGSVEWTKVDNSNPAKPLEDSEWKLTGPDGFTDMALPADCVAAAPDPVAGAYCVVDGNKFTVGGLIWGDYVLTETKAPAGYALDGTEHKFTIGAGDDLNIDLDSFVNKQLEGPELPLTGGQSAALFTGIGLLILGGAGGAALITRRRRLS